MVSSKSTFKGGCHCGGIRFEITTTKKLNPLSPRQCGCTFCQRHGVFGVSDPGGKLCVKISNSDNVNRYQFGHKTAEFLICKVCGVAPVVLSIIDDHLYSVLNGRSLDQPWPFDVSNIPQMDFGDEIPGERLERRKKNWIADVKVLEN